MNKLRGPEFELLQKVQDVQSTADRTLSLKQLSEELEMSQSQLSQKLGDLHERGWVEREQVSTDRGRVVRYTPRAGLQVRWISPAEGTAREWTCQGEIDWRYPLVSQVPDEPARHTLVSFLDQLRAEDLLDPGEIVVGEGEDQPHSFEHHGLTIFAYGSCVMDKARPGSDLDLVTVHPLASPRHEPRQEIGFRDLVQDLAAETSLHAPRPLQVKNVEEDGLVSLPSSIRDALLDHGVVVYDGLRHRRGGQTHGAWEFLEGRWFTD